MSRSQRRLLQRLYYTLGSPAAFGSISQLYKAARREDPTILKSDVRKFISDSYTHSRHDRAKRAVSGFVPNIVTNKNVLHGCDIGFFPKPTLVCTDAFTGKVMATPIANKNQETVIRAYSRLIQHQNDAIYPGQVVTDAG